MENMDDLVSHNDELIKHYAKEFKKTGKPIEVSFKSKLKQLNNSDRYTHLIHTYPAKLLMHIPFFFLNNRILSKKGDYVLDPFCGTGTVLLEAIIAKRRALGADANPLARLIANAKVSLYDEKKLKKTLSNLISKSKRYKNAPIPDVVNIDLWFPKKTQEDLAKLLKSIKGIKNEQYRLFFLVCFSNCVKKVSFADPRISVPVRINPKRFKKNSKRNKEASAYLQSIENVDVYDKFRTISLVNIERHEQYLKRNKNNKLTAKIISDDARNLTKQIGHKQKLKDESVQLVITSPPYAGAQKYIRSSSLCLGWTELSNPQSLIDLDRVNIGRENFLKSDLQIQQTGIKQADFLINQIKHKDIVRAKIVSQYLIEMESAINETIRVLRKGGYLVLIVGNNMVCNKEFNTQEYLTELILRKKLKLEFKLIDHIKSYGLMTKRNKTADVISREWVLVFKK